ncbi:MAG: hypothetical protein QG670_1267 [Thermoproteota archaeon]|nr:hypothetical protein [Thermoproteota archaeon]
MSYLVKSYMVKEVPTIADYTSAIDAARAMLKSGRGFLIILNGESPVGIVTEHDFVEKIIGRESDPTKTTVGEIMSSPLISVDPDEDLLKASELMQKHHIRRLPVMKSGIIYGVLTSRDISQGCINYVDKATREVLRWAVPFQP